MLITKTQTILNCGVLCLSTCNIKTLPIQNHKRNILKPTLTCPIVKIRLKVAVIL